MLRPLPFPRWLGIAVTVMLVATFSTLQAAPPEAAARPAPPPPPTAAQPHGMVLTSLLLRDQDLAMARDEAAAGQAGEVQQAGEQRRIQAAAGEADGDRRTFWSYNFGTQTYEQVAATLRKSSPRGYFYVADGSDGGNLDELAGRWEAIYTTTTGAFGEAPDVDRDSRVTLLLLDIKDGGVTGTIDAYFNIRNQSRSAAFSNQRELVYLDTSPTSPTSDRALGSLAHELARMINWNYHRSTAGQEIWLMEGLGELARYRNGFGHSLAASFFNAPDKQLNRWTPGSDNLSAAYLFLLYFWEQFGDAGTNGIVRHFGADMDAVEGALRALERPERLADVFQRWTVANFLDDPNIGGGIYAYRSLDLVLGEYDGVTTFPKAYRTTDYTVPVSDVGRVNPYAARYYRLFGGSGVLNLDFNGSNFHAYRVTALASSSTDFRSGNAAFPVDLNQSQDGGLALPDYGAAYPSVVMVITSVAEPGSTDFRFTATLGDTVPAPTPTATPFPPGVPTPTPFVPGSGSGPLATATPFSRQPTPTRAPDAPTATPVPGWPVAPAGCCLATAWPLNAQPGIYDEVRIFARLQDNAGRAVPNTPMEARFFFGALDGDRCQTGTDGDGMARCNVFLAGRALPGRTVPVVVTFTGSDGKRTTVRTQITPR